MAFRYLASAGTRGCNGKSQHHHIKRFRIAAALTDALASGQRSRAAYALRRSEPARQKSLWAYRGALFLARGGYAERLARPPTVFGYMPAMADRRLPPGKRCRRCCAFLSAIVEDAINPFGVLERILYWWCSA